MSKNSAYPELNKASFETLLRLQFTREEVLVYFGKSKTGLIEWVKKEYEGRTFEDIKQMCTMQTQVRLKSTALKMSEKNPAVMIFLLKSICRMSDETPAQTENNDKNVISFTNSIKIATKALASADNSPYIAGLPDKTNDNIDNKNQDNE